MDFARSAEIRMKGGISNRAIKRLFPVEVNAETPTDSQMSESDNSTRDDHVESLNSESVLPNVTNQPAGRAALKADSCIQGGPSSSNQDANHTRTCEFRKISHSEKARPSCHVAERAKTVIKGWASQLT